MRMPGLRQWLPRHRAPKMEAIRYQIDKLELLVEDDLWTLPKYRELLFIR